MDSLNFDLIRKIASNLPVESRIALRRSFKRASKAIDPEPLNEEIQTWREIFGPDYLIRDGSFYYKFDSYEIYSSGYDNTDDMATACSHLMELLKDESRNKDYKNKFINPVYVQKKVVVKNILLVTDLLISFDSVVSKTTVYYMMNDTLKVF